MKTRQMKSSRCLHPACCVFATPPGDTLRETLKAMKITQTALAETMRRPIKTINEIIKGKARLTEQTAIELEYAIGIPAHLWLALECNYRLAIARRHNASDQATASKRLP